MDPTFLDISASLDGFCVWLGDERLVTDVTEAEARKAYRAALELAAEARTQITRTLERTV